MHSQEPSGCNQQHWGRKKTGVSFQRACCFLTITSKNKDLKMNRKSHVGFFQWIRKTSWLLLLQPTCKWSQTLNIDASEAQTNNVPLHLCGRRSMWQWEIWALWGKWLLRDGGGIAQPSVSLFLLKGRDAWGTAPIQWHRDGGISTADFLQKTYQKLLINLIGKSQVRHFRNEMATKKKENFLKRKEERKRKKPSYIAT